MQIENYEYKSRKNTVLSGTLIRGIPKKVCDSDVVVDAMKSM